MKIWPELDENGYLPRGVHRTSLSSLLGRFGLGSPQRIRAAERLRRIYLLAQQTGCLARFIVFGSFVTGKQEPNDADIFIVMEDSFEVGSVAAESKLVFDHQAAQNYLGASVFWIRRQAAIWRRGQRSCILADKAGWLVSWNRGGY